MNTFLATAGWTAPSWPSSLRRVVVQVIVIGPGTVTDVIDDQLWQFLQKYTADGGFVIIDAAAG